MLMVGKIEVREIILMVAIRYRYIMILDIQINRSSIKIIKRHHKIYSICIHNNSHNSS